MSKYIIRIKNNDYPYFTDELTRENDWIRFSTVSKKGEKRNVELARSEISSIEEMDGEKTF